MTRAVVTAGSGKLANACVADFASYGCDVRDLRPGRGEIGPNDTLLSIDKARRLLGYNPQHSWRHKVIRTV